MSRKPGDFSGRDRRDRSPPRHPSGGSQSRNTCHGYDLDKVTSRSGYEARDDNHGHGQGYDRRGRRGSRGDMSSLESAPTSGVEKLPDLPNNLKIPEFGHKISHFSSSESQGGLGRSVRVRLNHFLIMSLPKGPIYQYSIVFQLDPESIRNGSDKVSKYNQGRAMIKAIDLFGGDFVFDGMSRGWTPKSLMSPGSTRSSLLDLGGNDKGFKIKLTVLNEGQLNNSTFMEYLESGFSGTATVDPALENWFKYLTALFRHDPAKKFITVHNSSAYFQRSPNLIKVLESTGGVLEALRGIYQSVSVTFGGLNINLDVTCSAFYTPNMCMIEVLRAFNGVQPSESITPAMIPRLLEGARRMVGMFFVVKHLDKGRNSRPIRTTSISNADAQNTTFELKETISNQTRQISIYDYFKNRYRISLRYPKLPMLVTRIGIFPMELCFTPQGERYKEALQGRETADFIQFATSKAYVRSSQIYENAKRLSWHDSDILKAHGVTVEPQMMERKARVLPAPRVTYGTGTDSNPSWNGSWNLRGKRFIKGISMNAYGLVYFPYGKNQVPQPELKNFLIQLTREFNTYGIKIPPFERGAPSFLHGNVMADIEEVIKEIYHRTKSDFGKKPQLFIFMLHEGCDPRIYKIIKQVCDTKCGVPSQVMLVEKSLRGRGLQQYLANIALKVNIKLGGQNSFVQDSFLKQKYVMHIDVSHPSPSERRKQPPPPSFASLTGSYDDFGSLYTAVAAAQPAGEEMIKAQKEMFKELLHRYKLKQGRLPEIVLLWRDGLSESQITGFMDHEIKALKDFRNENKANYKIVALIAVKRHHTRIFPASQQGDKNGNVAPGTIVEASTNKGGCDFFLVSATALQGTITPTRYRRVYDEVGITVDDAGRLVMAACFAYGRATRSVSQHSAVMYSHQVAERARMWLRKDDDTGQVTLPQVHEDLIYTQFWQ